MKRLLAALALLLAPVAPGLNAQFLGGCNVSTPFNVGNGVVLAQCLSEISNNAPQDSAPFSSAATVPITAGNSAVIFAYLCEPGSGIACTSAASSVGYLFPSSSSTSYTAISGATYLYDAMLQDPSLTGTSAAPCTTAYPYCNVVWYLPTVPSLGTNVNLTMYCSSTAPPTYTNATTCNYISVFYLEFSGMCTTAGTACLDQVANNSVTGTSLSVTTGSVTYTNELCLALGGTINDESLSPTQGGDTLTVPLNSNANIVFGKGCTGSGTQTLGQSWTGSDIGGMLMVTLQTAASTAIEPSGGCLPWLCQHRGAP